MRNGHVDTANTNDTIYAGAGASDAIPTLRRSGSGFVGRLTLKRGRLTGTRGRGRSFRGFSRCLLT